jgi:hypothetical protein
MERCCEAHLKAPDARPIGHAAASAVAATLGLPQAGWMNFQWLARTYLPEDLAAPQS